MKHLVKALICSALLSAIPLTTFALDARVVGYKDCAQFPSDMEFQDKPMFCGESASLALMVESQGLVAIKEDSLKLTSLTLNGVDISANRKGEPSYEIGSFPKVSEDGKYGVFEILINHPVFGQLQKIKAAGTIDLLTSNSLATPADTKVDFSKPFSIVIGPYTLSNHHQQPDPQGSNTIGNTIAKGLADMFSPNSSQTNYSIHMLGDRDALVSIEIIDGNNIIKTTSSSWGGELKTFYFDKPKQAAGSIRIKYWKDIKVEVVGIKI